MTEAIEERTTTKTDQWRERLAEQERSGLTVKRFCEERGITQYSLYAWRKRLREQGPVRFALVERGGVRQEPASAPGLELILVRGVRLRIGAGVDGTTLRTVLGALRA
jgi:transposase-like protein